MDSLPAPSGDGRAPGGGVLLARFGVVGVIDGPVSPVLGLAQKVRRAGPVRVKPARRTIQAYVVTLRRLATFGVRGVRGGLGIPVFLGFLPKVASSP
jgi:hypothetical protein